MDKRTNGESKITPWETLEELDVSPSRYYPVFKQTVKIHNGITVEDYYVSRLPDAAIVVAITPAKELLMVRQWRQGIQETTLELPAGQNDGRVPIDAAQSELHEETGATTSNLSPLGAIALFAPKNSLKVYGFFCYVNEITEEQDLDPNENIEVVKVPIGEIDALLISGVISCAETISFITFARLKFPEAFLR